ncbi:MAG: hypothetical protein O3A00_10850 [Planctomycetota bacterium]|nr:hypothetical protein [Planctomycetota bacterium]
MTFVNRSQPKTEIKSPQLARDITELVEPDSQTDPKFQRPVTALDSEIVSIDARYVLTNLYK